MGTFQRRDARSASPSVFYTSRRGARKSRGRNAPGDHQKAGKKLIMTGQASGRDSSSRLYVIGIYLERPSAPTAGAVLGTGLGAASGLHTLRRALRDPRRIAIRHRSAFEPENAAEADTGLKDGWKRFRERCSRRSRKPATARLTYSGADIGCGRKRDYELAWVEGKDFADVLFWSLWIGREAGDPALRAALLAGGR